MNIHKINSHLHHSFLEEERKDSVTGDLIQANDEVVFCAICKSVFQKDSWEYMDRKHCGQTKTLKKVPISTPLVLNISIIKPDFITLTNSSIPFEDCLNLLSDFKTRTKKVEIRLKSSLKQGTKKNDDLLKKFKRKAEENKLVLNRPQLIPTVKQDEDRTIIISMIILLGLGLSIPLFLFFDDVWTKIIIIAIVILPFYLFFRFLLFLNKKVNIYIKKINTVSLEKLHNKFETKESITFGVSNNNLFFYFEELQQSIFIQLESIDTIDFKYQSDCYVFVIFKNKSVRKKDVKIPLIFSKTVQINTFLIELAKAKNGNPKSAQIIVTNFPANQIDKLTNSLLLYPDIEIVC